MQAWNNEDKKQVKSLKSLQVISRQKKMNPKFT
jgi:hypothetical protein